MWLSYQRVYIQEVQNKQEQKGRTADSAEELKSIEQKSADHSSSTEKVAMYVDLFEKDIVLASQIDPWQQSH